MKRKCESLREFCKSERKMFSDKNKIDETSGLSFIVICDNKIILFYEQISILKLEKYSLPICSMYEVYKLNKLLQGMAPPLESSRSPVLLSSVYSFGISFYLCFWLSFKFYGKASFGVSFKHTSVSLPSPITTNPLSSSD